jgi:hypothetical protein
MQSMPTGTLQNAAGSSAATPRFTIIVPLHNKARYIGATLASALAQEWSDFEVIVVDDGSTDAGAAVVVGMHDPRVRLVCQANSGVSIARNRAIDLARGEWIAFLDADDWQHPGYLARLVATQDAHPDLDAVATRFVEFRDHDGGPPPSWHVPPGTPEIERIADLPRRWLKGPSLFTGSIAVRTRVLREMQPCFHPGDSYGEDLDLWFRIAERTTIGLAHVPLVAYRTQVGGSLTQQELPRAPAFIDRMRARALSGRMGHAQAASSLAYIAQLQVDLARNSLMAGSRIESWKWLLAARRAVFTKRWWLTAAMALFWPTGLARSYVFRARRRGLEVATH